MRAAAPIALWLALSMAAPAAFATEVNGRVVVNGTLAATAEPAPRTYYWSLDNGVLAPREDRIFPERDLAIVLTQRGRAPARATEPVVLHIAQGGLWPASVAVRSGAQVRIQNDDPFTHELYSPSHPDFAPEAMAPGQSRPIAVPGSGQVEIRCKRSPHLRGFVAVVDAAYVVTPGADGTFTLEVEPGTYTVRTFFEGRWLPESELVINAERSQTVELAVDASAARPRSAPAPSPGAGAGTNPAPAVAPPAPAPAVPR